MNPEVGLAWFRIAIFFTLISGILILFEPPNSAEFIISVASFLTGLAFIAMIAFIMRRG